MNDRSQLLEKLHQVSFATLGHLLEEGFVSSEIRSMICGVKLVGKAVTLSVVNADAVAVNRALASLQDGDVLVIDMNGDVRHACVGTVTACAALAQGARGIVVDGLITDIVELRAAGLPIYARGTNLLTTKLHGNAESRLNVPVQCGGVRVSPGDLVLGDENGLLILPRETLEAVVDQALLSDHKESDLLRRLQAGDPIDNLLRVN
ncbi:RraA family protein [Pseudomonas sp. NBRC 111137]|uniref:RraA family protein n=1 Tax=Pseudomonas sp. NBRC 111137 TaxID=1661052 RepID=UPI0006D41007|nr:RraA family protein [Pseudomonas sp. NBRC 111137]